MKKFRKKAIVIEAEQWFPGSNMEIVKEEVWKDGPYEGYKKAYVETLEGIMLVSPGDYIIKGINGEFYPCKPDIFAKTYDPVE